MFWHFSSQMRIYNRNIQHMKEEIQETGTDETQEDAKFWWSCPCQDNVILCVTQSIKNAEKLRIRTWSATLLTLIIIVKTRINKNIYFPMNGYLHECMWVYINIHITHSHP